MRLTEEDIRKIALVAIEEMGDKAAPDLVKRVVSKAVERAETGEVKSSETGGQSSGRVILTSFGVNQPGIVSSISAALSASGCDIQDITQKILQEFFTMIMIVDISHSPKDLKQIQDEMTKIAENLKVKIYLQHEDIFRYMHRI